MTFRFIMGRNINKRLLLSIAKRIKELRTEKGITQEVFYNDTGINIGRIERAIRDFSMTTLEAICSYLGVSLEEFFKGVKHTKTKKK
jgi:transcriptional regulator with XRE-family HTH domain